ncbi:MAG TPA: hypothetical protein VK190_03515 [Pseudoneobacillus sp.]|nr:hypothetical protein [Pseudoneobacillus sp.]
MKYICPECGKVLQEKRIDGTGWNQTTTAGVKREHNVNIKLDVLECPDHPGIYVIKDRDLKDFGRRAWTTASLDYQEVKIAGFTDPMVNVEEVKK